MLFYLFSFAIALCLSAFFAGVETGVVRLDPLHLSRPRAIAENARKILTGYIKQREEMLSMTLLGNNLALVIASTLATSFLFNVFKLETQGSLIVIAVVTPVLLIFGEIMPKTLFLHQTAPKLFMFRHIILFFRIIFAPLVWLITNLSKKVVELVLKGSGQNEEKASREDVRLMLHLMSGDGKQEEELHRYISRFLSLEDTQAKEVMRPLMEVVSLDPSAPVEDVIQLIVKSGYTRLPIYDPVSDTISGMIHAKDLLVEGDGLEPHRPVPRNLIRKVTFLPETKRLPALLSDMQTKRTQSTVLIDEFGSTVGLVSMEDIIEQIVGDIYDEYDPEENVTIRKIGKNRFLVTGRLDIDTLKDELGVDLPKAGFETVAGFILWKAGRIPKPREHFFYGKIKLTVLQMDRRRIDYVIIERLKN